MVDKLKQESDFPKNLDVDPELLNLCVKFYHDQFWVVINGDSIPVQEIADKIYDTAVNMSPLVSIKIFQNTLNILNKNQKLYRDIEDDGKIGQDTLGALGSYLATDSVDLLLKVMNVSQGCRYLQLLLEPDQEDFARGWFSRVEINKI